MFRWMWSIPQVSMAAVYDAQVALMRSILGPEAEIRAQHNDRSACCTNCFSIEACNVVAMFEGWRAQRPPGVTLR